MQKERPGRKVQSSSKIATSKKYSRIGNSLCTGIHPNGKPPQAAAREIARIVSRILEQRSSGMALKE
jgi:ethanolamine ammonia-lyase small subunit